MKNPESNSLPNNWALRFFSIFTGQAFSLFGSSLVQFALVWYLTQETGSATILATASLFAMLPQILLGPIAGTIVDRGNRRIIMITSDALIAISTLFLAYLFWAGLTEIWHIYLILAIRSAGGAFHYPAMAASTSLMVPEKHLSRVAGATTIRGLLAGVVNAVLTGATLLRQLLESHRRSPAAPLGSLAAEVVAAHRAQPLDTEPNPPFWGKLEEPAATGRLKYGRLTVTGWLAHHLEKNGEAFRPFETWSQIAAALLEEPPC